MTYDNAIEIYEDEFIAWIYENYSIGNGTMLINIMENGKSFDDFMDARHADIEMS